jgi:class 3 adenylate cyclase
VPHLTAEDLKEIGVTAIGHRHLLLQAIADLQESGASAVEAASEQITSSEGVNDAAKRPSEAERRQLTVLFCDLVGSTALSARFDPEDMGHVIRAYQKCCTEVVQRWGGHLARWLSERHDHNGTDG